MTSTRPATNAQARHRLRTAQAYLEVARLALGEDSSMLAVAAGDAVLAGIAGADAICAVRLGSIHRGKNHREAVTLLKTATPDGQKLAAVFARLIDVKDEAHYGLAGIASGKAADAVKWAGVIVERACEEVER